MPKSDNNNWPLINFFLTYKLISFVLYFKLFFFFFLAPVFLLLENLILPKKMVSKDFS